MVRRIADSEEEVDTDITDDDCSTNNSKSKPKSRKNKNQKKKTTSNLTVVRQEPISSWSRFLRWCENSNNLGYLQGILFLNTLLIYGLNYWFKSQYGYDPMTFLSARYLDVNIPDLNNNNLNQDEQ
jgi:hypothetical protein